MQQLHTFARRSLIGAALLYAATLVTLVLLWTLRPQLVWWITMANIFAAPLFLPLVLLVPLACCVRSRGLRSATLVSTLIFVTLFGTWLLPVSHVPAEGVPLRVVTFNHWYSNQHIDTIIASIREQQADIVALQELSAPVAVAIRQQLRVEYPHQILAAAEGDYGVGIISRYPLRDMEHTYSFSGQMAVAQVGGRAVTLINVHLPAPSLNMQRLGREQPWRRLWRPVGYNAKLRTDEFPALLEAIDATSGPLIVLGDHNTGDREPPYADLAARMHDAWRETNWGFGFTFPNDKRVGALRLAFPLVRIDYVWSKNGITPASAQVLCGRTGADHCMLVANLRLATH